MLISSRKNKVFTILREPVTWKLPGYELTKNTYTFPEMRKLPVTVEKHGAWINDSSGHGFSSNECRIVPQDIEDEYNSITAQISELRSKQIKLLADNFLSFPLLTQDRCKIESRAFNTKSEASKALKGEQTKL